MRTHKPNTLCRPHGVDLCDPLTDVLGAAKRTLPFIKLCGKNKHPLHSALKTRGAEGERERRERLIYQTPVGPAGGWASLSKGQLTRCPL